MRLFYGIPLPKEIRERLSQTGLEKSGTKMKIVETENLHVTLLFLGEKENVEPFVKVLEEVPKGSFRVVIGGMGAFPSKERARVVWAGLTPEEKVINIHRVISSKLGLEESEYKPHITLARLKSKPDEVVREVLGKNLGISFVIDRVQLLKSELTPKGPKYEVIHETRL